MIRTCLSLAAVGLTVIALAGCQASARPVGPVAAAPQAVARGVVQSREGLVRIAAPVQGVLASVNLYEGDVVVQGDVLARMDDRLARLTLAAADADVAQFDAQTAIADARAGGAHLQANRLGRLAFADAGPRDVAEGAAASATVAQRELTAARLAAQAARAHRQLQVFDVDLRTVRAPVSGRIIRRTAVTGASVEAGTALFLIEPAGAPIVSADLDETYADRIRPGAKALISLESDPSKVYPAHVSRVAEAFGAPMLQDDPTAPSDTRTLPVQLTLDGAPALRLGQRVLVRFVR